MHGSRHQGRWGAGSSHPFKEQSIVFNMAEALRRVGNDRQLFYRLLEFFFEDYPDLMGRLHLGLDRRDATGVELAAHRLKNLAANFDAAEAVTLASQVEQAASQHDLKEARRLAELLDDAISELRSTLLPYRG